MKYCLFLILLVCCFGNAGSSTVDSLFKRYRRDVEIERLGGACEKWDDETRISYYTLILNSPTDSLIPYVEDPIPSIRCRIFTGLLYRRVSQATVQDILQRHRSDTAFYVDCLTDNIQEWRVAEYMQFFSKRDILMPSLVNLAERLEAAQARKQHPIQIPGVYHGLVPKDSLLRLDSLVDPERRFHVVSFELSTRDSNMKVANVFTPEVKAFINTFRYRETVYIDNIRAFGPDGTLRILTNLRLIVE